MEISRVSPLHETHTNDSINGETSGKREGEGWLADWSTTAESNTAAASGWSTEPRASHSSGALQIFRMWCLHSGNSCLHLMSTTITSHRQGGIFNLPFARQQQQKQSETTSTNGVEVRTGQTGRCQLHSSISPARRTEVWSMSDTGPNWPNRRSRRRESVISTRRPSSSHPCLQGGLGNVHKGNKKKVTAALLPSTSTFCQLGCSRCWTSNGSACIKGPPTKRAEPSATTLRSCKRTQASAHSAARQPIHYNALIIQHIRPKIFRL